MAKKTKPVEKATYRKRVRLTKHGIEVVYIGATIRLAVAEKIDVVAARENLTFSQVVARVLEKEFGE